MGAIRQCVHHKNAVIMGRRVVRQSEIGCPDQGYLAMKICPVWHPAGLRQQQVGIKPMRGVIGKTARELQRTKAEEMPDRLPIPVLMCLNLGPVIHRQAGDHPRDCIRWRAMALS